MWKIVGQYDKKAKDETLIREIRLYPMGIDEETGNKKFGRLKFRLYQIVVADERDYFVLKMSTYHSEKDPEFILEHPDKLEHPMLVVGTGKNKRAIRDVLSPRISVKGMKEKYSLSEFAERIRGFMGDAHKDVLRLFASV